MVYEFDAGDILQSNMYPAMTRSFRTAGFQWATQFAYDPMATAYANTEYQTHLPGITDTQIKDGIYEAKDLYNGKAIYAIVIAGVFMLTAAVSVLYVKDKEKS